MTEGAAIMVESKTDITKEIEEEAIYFEDEPFVSAWKQVGEGHYPLFANVSLNNYNSMHTQLYQSFGGKIPIMYMKDRDEFEKLICEILYKGVKREIPASMGALTIKGWKDIFGQSHRAILLSDGYYSAVLPEEIDIDPEDWKQKSLILRRAHECTHYYTLRAYGFMNNALKDELIADTMGLIESFGEYRHDLFLRFMGLENYPEYRWGGRLQNYRPRDRVMTENEFILLQQAAYDISRELQEHIEKNPQYLKDQTGKLKLLRKLAGIDSKSFESRFKQRSRNGRLFD
ncbi:MAG: hypothetical protein PHV71_03495 [Eubacteriales bacterium]|nr:hypothetical protein [Eubacteriales bacterium]MDD3199104.1 hypothetical protein [Eubacteriales bacterium]MDD4629653.1 hypothetical protein [Eubacteriales bacterium]